jgi:hypothetical protein
MKKTLFACVAALMIAVGFVGCSKPTSGKVIAKIEQKESYFTPHEERNPFDKAKLAAVYWLILEGNIAIPLDEHKKAEWEAIKVGDIWTKK